ncbi:hypothetical protein GmHk_18G052004 [Glycine max]|nr:hypothetical protein GmHk_18G052004 [Glycine max]
MTSYGQLTSWPIFLHALQTRFTPSQYEDPTGALFKLTQNTTMHSYLSEFEDLENRASGLACLQEEKILDNCRAFRGRATPFPSTMTAKNSPPISLPIPPPLSSSPKPSVSVPLKWLTPEELALQWERGLCFNCEEKYHRDHRCTSRVFLLIVYDEEHCAEVYIPLSFEPKPPDPNDPTVAQFNLHSLMGPLALGTLRLLGFIADQKVLILVDGGSTHWRFWPSRYMIGYCSLTMTQQT